MYICVKAFSHLSEGILITTGMRVDCLQAACLLLSLLRTGLIQLQDVATSDYLTSLGFESERQSLGVCYQLAPRHTCALSEG